MATQVNITPSFWRVLLLNLAFAWHMTRPRLSRYAWRLARFAASERTHMALAAYCSGVVMTKRIIGEYEDPEPTTYVLPQSEDVN